MFTGIVTAVGTVRLAERRVDGFELTVRCDYPDLQLGESIAVDGACLTVQALTDGGFTAHIIDTSLERTRFADYHPNQQVNLERALRAGDRLGGHLVQGHVDGVGTLVGAEPREDARLLSIQVPEGVGRVSIPLGSITVDGVSLTIQAKPEVRLIQVSLIPFTLRHTTLGQRRVGDQVHLEADTIGKYVAALTKDREEEARRQ